MSIKQANILAVVILALGMTQFLGGWFGVKALKGFGASLAMAPYTKVFSDVNGLETFASTFEILTKKGDYWSSMTITPEVYGKLKGSYNRRNVYGAGLSYGPKLPEDLRRQIFSYALHAPAFLKEEIGIPSGEAQVVVIKTRTKGRNDKWYLASTEKEEKSYEKLMAP
jgi:hypothetical protein